MRVHVVNLDPGAPRRAPVVDWDIDSGVDDVLWVPVPRTVAPLALDAFLVAAAPTVALQSEAVVLGLTPETAAELHGYPEVLSYVHRRVELAPIYTARIVDAKPVLVHEAGDAVPAFAEAPEDVLSVLREADVSTLLRRGGAELPAHDILHYEGPNGRHYRAFLRPGLALRGLAELDRGAFWLVEHMSRRFRFLVDHWSLTALAYHLGGYLRRLGIEGPPVQVEALTSYDEDYEVLYGRVTRAFRGGDPAVGVLVSVNSSGRLARRMMAVTSVSVPAARP